MATGAPKKAAPAPAKVPLTFAAVRAQIKRPRKIIPLVMDTEAAAEIEALEALLEHAQRQDESSGVPPLAPDVAKRLAAVEDAVQESVADFILQAVSHVSYQALRREHPPTAEQVAAFPVGDTPAFDHDTFYPALVLAQLLSPEPPEPAEWQDFWDELSDGQMRQLAAGALAVQMQTVQIGSRSQNAAEVLRQLGLPD